jgi:hypothetical protein
MVPTETDERPFSSHLLLTIREFLDGGQARQGLGNPSLHTRDSIAMKLMFLLVLMATIIAVSFLPAQAHRANLEAAE